MSCVESQLLIFYSLLIFLKLALKFTLLLICDSLNFVGFDELTAENSSLSIFGQGIFHLNLLELLCHLFNLIRLVIILFNIFLVEFVLFDEG